MKHLKHLLLLVCCCITVSGYARKTAATDSNETCSGNCCCAGSEQTPIGITTDHVHGKGQWMASYMYMNMAMDGNRAGAAKASDAAAYVNYIMAPKKMIMQMHMAMLMYGVTDRLTLMAMGGYNTNSMSMGMAPMHYHPIQLYVLLDNGPMESSGFTDTKIYALYSLVNKPTQHITATLGVNIPSGSINEVDASMYAEKQVLPYCMQPGTGTFGLLPSITYVTIAGRFSFGGQAGADIKLGRNQQNYKFGNIYNVNAWAAYRVLHFMSASLRAEGIATGKINGYDADIALYRNNDPTADAANSGGQRINMYAGLNFSFIKLKGLHLLAEYGMPVYEYVNGLQMSSKRNLLAGAQFTF